VNHDQITAATPSFSTQSAHLGRSRCVMLRPKQDVRSATGSSCSRLISNYARFALDVLRTELARELLVADFLEGGSVRDQ
jgi:hypothetical protein